MRGTVLSAFLISLYSNTVSHIMLIISILYIRNLMVKIVYYFVPGHTEKW